MAMMKTKDNLKKKQRIGKEKRGDEHDGNQKIKLRTGMIKGISK